MTQSPFEQHNPILEPENYFENYKKSIDEMRKDPRIIEFDRLCFELFERNEQGKRFMEIVVERYIIPALAKPGTATYQLDVMWGEGFKDFPRMIRMAVQSHNQRIMAESK